MSENTQQLILNEVRKHSGILDNHAKEMRRLSENIIQLTQIEKDQARSEKRIEALESELYSRIRALEMTGAESRWLKVIFSKIVPAILLAGMLYVASNIAKIPSLAQSQTQAP